MVCLFHDDMSSSRTRKRGSELSEALIARYLKRYPITDAFLVFKYPRFGWGDYGVCSSVFAKDHNSHYLRYDF